MSLRYLTKVVTTSLLLFVLLSSFTFEHLQAQNNSLLEPSKNELDEDVNYLITRIIDVTYPIFNRSYPDDHYSIFESLFTLEVENPTNSGIACDYWGAPYPFPLFDCWLQDDNISVEYGCIIEWVDGYFHYKPGEIRQRQVYVAFWFYNYVSKELPIGWFTFWFDFVAISWVSVPVITYGMTIFSLEDRIRYYYEYDDHTEEYLKPLPKPTQSTTPLTTEDVSVSLVDSVFIVMLMVFLLRKKRKSFKIC